MELHQKECTPCHVGAPALVQAEKERLLTQLGEGWALTHDNTRIFRNFPFENFLQSMDFANQAGEIAERVNHHPELLVGWGHCGVEIWTHKIDDLTEDDFVLAAKIEQLLL